MEMVYGRANRQAQRAMASIRYPTAYSFPTAPPQVCRCHLMRQHRRFLAAASSPQPAPPPPPQQQVNLSVLRFTLGIPGLDESYLPRWIGLGCGALVVINHLLSPSPTLAQIRSEALGLCLAAFSTTLPFIGKLLEGGNSLDSLPVAEGSRQIFVMSDDLSQEQKEDLAWTSFALLSNTKTISVLIAVQDAMCIRGYWNAPEDLSKAATINWFGNKLQECGYSDLNDSLYFPCSSDPQFSGILPKAAVSILLQPILPTTSQKVGNPTTAEGFILLASNTNFPYGEKDMKWIRSIAHKLEGFSALSCTTNSE